MAVKKKTNVSVPAPGPLDPPDPWVGRSVGMRCSSCIWFVKKGELLGRCRRRCPTHNGYPVVFPSDWCGDHKLDENKI